MATQTFDPTRVLCALDVEQPFESVLRAATSIAARGLAHLHLLHVWDPWVASAPEAGLLTPTEEAMSLQTRLASRLATAASTARRWHDRVHTSLIPGTPWEQIVLFADTQGCDLIVTGTHGRRGIARLLLGSVAERVVRASTVPVLVVPMTPDTALRPDDEKRRSTWLAWKDDL